MLAVSDRITSKALLSEWLQYEHAKYGNISGMRYLFQMGERAKLWKHQMLLRKAEKQNTILIQSRIQ